MSSAHTTARIFQKTQLRTGINRVFKLRDRFFRKKQPDGEFYSFTPHDPYEIFIAPKGFSRLALIGDNWKEREASKQKPIAVLFGFNNWKLGFTASYLPEYRTAFMRRKARALETVYTLLRLPVKPSLIVVWGFNQPGLLTRYAKFRGIPIYRMEDGFIRSVELGASHATPYSLVLDTVGLYYEPRKPSDIETLLNTYDFSAQPDLLQQAENILQLIRSYAISKYNQAHVRTNHSFSLSRRILVVGQVDNDVSLKRGNPDGWRMEELLRLAKEENPEAELLYRPHPDVYRGYQRSKFRARKVENFAKIIAPDVPLTSLLDSVDHLYTITSLAGLEALLRGIRVTTVGAPFYAGWGLTDDRANWITQTSKGNTKNPFVRRTRKLSPIELFAGAYLLYPRYLGDTNDGINGCVAACLRIIGEMEESRSAIQLFNETMSLPQKKAIIKNTAQSDDWRILFLPKHKAAYAEERYYKMILHHLNIDKILLDTSATLYQKSLTYFIAGFLTTNDEVDLLLSRVRNRLSHKSFNEILLYFSAQRPGNYLVAHYAWLVEQTGNAHQAQSLPGMLKPETVDPKKTDETQEEKDHSPEDSSSNALLSLALLHFKNGNYSAAQKICKKLLFSATEQQQSLSLLARIAHEKFDFASAALLARMVIALGNTKTRPAMANLYLRCLRHGAPFAPQEFLSCATSCIAIKPDLISSTLLLTDMFKRHYPFSHLYRSLVTFLDFDNHLRFEKAQAYIATEQPAKAVAILENLLKRNGDDYRVLSLLCQAYTYLRDFSKARTIIESAIAKYRNAYTYKEGMRLAIVMNDPAWGRQLLREAKQYNIPVGEMTERKIHYVNREIHEALETMRHIRLRQNLKACYPKHYIAPEQVEQDWHDAHMFVLALYGPGDEVRFAQIYGDIARDPHFGKVTISCDPRFQSLLERSYPTLDFVSVARVREYGTSFDLAKYNALPGYELHHFLDNTGHDIMKKTKRALFVSDLLAKYRRGYADFNGKSWLIPDPEHIAQYHARFAGQQRPLIGISWRSSLSTFSRNEHYLSIEELAPIFEIEGLQFVNLQYDECSHELAWVEERYPGKLINIPELDQYNDFEGVTALMKTMDLVISPATTVVELAGSVGCPTWILSNSAELNCRKVENGYTDIWHNSMTHIEGRELGNKADLVTELTQRLQEFANAQLAKKVA